MVAKGIRSSIAKQPSNCFRKKLRRAFCDLYRNKEFPTPGDKWDDAIVFQDDYSTRFTCGHAFWIEEMMPRVYMSDFCVIHSQMIRLKSYGQMAGPSFRVVKTNYATSDA